MRASLPLLGFGLLLVFFAMSVYHPGIPAVLQNDEPAYYFAAASLLHDNDLELRQEDLDRAYADFPDTIANLILITNDGWSAVYFAKPFVYSFLAVPFCGLFGLNGFFVFNALLFMAMVVMGWAWLSRFTSSPLAAAFSFSFFFVSVTPRCVFWIQPELFNMAMVMAAMFCCFFPFAEGPAPDAGRAEKLLRRAFNWRTLPLIGMTALALAAANKPPNLMAAIPIFGSMLFDLRIKRAIGWGAALAAGLAAITAGQYAYTGLLSPYFGGDRAGIHIEGHRSAPPYRNVVLVPGADPAASSPGPEAATGPKGGGHDWRWAFVTWRMFDLGRVLHDAEYYLIGRHIGVFPYFPFTLVCLGLFAAGPRPRAGWLVLAAFAAYVAFFLVVIPHNYHGGNGFVGNRYFINIYPVFLFLVTRIRRPWVLLPGWVLGALFVSQIVMTPFGATTAAAPTQQVHARNYPFQLLPFEINLRGKIPGYAGAGQGMAYLHFRRDQAWAEGEGVWIRGGVSAEGRLLTTEPLGRVYFDLVTRVPNNRCVIKLGKDRKEVVFGDGGGRYEWQSRIVLLDSGKPEIFNGVYKGEHIYRMRVSADRGVCNSWVDEGSADERYLGCKVLFVGRASEIDSDIYHVNWREVNVPAGAAAGAEVAGSVVFGLPDAPVWWGQCALAPQLRVQWLKDGRRFGESIVDVEGWKGPGNPIRLPVTIKAPSAPGLYEVALDVGFRDLWWFSSRNPGAEKRIPVTVSGPQG